MELERSLSQAVELAKRRGLRQWYWMPASIVVFGLLSLSMLISINRVNQRQHAHFALVNAVTELRIRIATSHLWFEEGISNATAEDRKRAATDFEEAARLSQAILDGGPSDNGIFLSPLADPELRGRAQEIRGLIAEFGGSLAERRQVAKFAGIGSALETRTDAIFDRLQRSAADLEAIVLSSTRISNSCFAR